MSRLLIIGDAMVDVYCHGTASRISPEAPIPILLNPKVTKICGGASNVAINLASLGHEVHFISNIGDDENGLWLEEQLKKNNVVTYKKIKGIKTIIKTRYLASGQQILRVDNEEICSKDVSIKLKNLFCDLVEKFDGIILSDYGKGTLYDAQNLIRISNQHKKPSFVDPKQNNLEFYKGCTFITPNSKEADQFFGSNYDKDIVFKRANECLIKNVVITMSDKGAHLYNKNKIKEFPTVSRSVVDVTGAGDCFISALVHMYFANNSIDISIQSAVNVATKSVEKFGNYILKESDFYNPKTVFTNGCFDILHAGHVSYLEKAANLGSNLIIGLNSDSSVTKLKGKGRPINNFENRKKVLEGLSFVDKVICFDEPTPEKLIKEIKPDVLVKGADYTKDEVAGAEFVESYGGKVYLIEFEENLSTTKILEKENHFRDDN